MSLRPELQAVFLDVGNTLLREEPSRFEIYAQAARARGARVDAAGMRTLMGAAHRALPLRLDGAYRFSDPWFEAFIAHIFGRELGLGAAAVGEVTAELFERFEDARTFRVYPGAEELLETCRRRGLILGVISNWSARLPNVLRALDLERRIDLVLCSALEQLEKPDPTLFRAALERAGVPPEAALHAGDHPANDGYAARSLGIDAVLVDHAGALSPEQADGIPRVASLSELQGRILSRLAPEAS